MNTSNGSVVRCSAEKSETGARAGVCSTARSSSRTRRQTVDGSPSVSRTLRCEAYTGMTRPSAPRMP
ncbi:hypothetical protein ASD26_21905 [Streptomyces sp. Root1319]|nr:hypothetical protein ASD26_21905 [Streptomyces sp. Root1319]